MIRIIHNILCKKKTQLVKSVFLGLNNKIGTRQHIWRLTHGFHSDFLGLSPLVSVFFFSWFEFDLISILSLFYWDIIAIRQICVVQVGVVKLFQLASCATFKHPYHGIPKIAPGSIFKSTFMSRVWPQCKFRPQCFWKGHVTFPDVMPLEQSKCKYFPDPFPCLHW